MELRDRWVCFRIRDVYIPDPRKLLEEMFGEHLLQGRVVDFSDNGTKDGRFAVVELDGWKEPLVIPVNRIVSAL